jgi:hypothetical protein
MQEHKFQNRRRWHPEPFVLGAKFVNADDLLVVSFCTQSFRKAMKAILRHDWLAEFVLG